MATLNYLISQESFIAALVMNISPREKFGEPGIQDKDNAGTPLWAVDVAVTNPPVEGRKPVTDVITIKVAAANIRDLPPQYTPVTFHGLRMGVSGTSLRGDRVAGGQPYFTADKIVPAHQQPQKAAA